jgi:hypothetical protein
MFRTELRTGATVITAVILTVALASFEVFNLATNREALQILTGSAQWAIMLTAGLVLLDFGGLARLFAQQQGGAGGPAALFLGLAWLISAAANAWLTHFALLSAMLAGAVVADGLNREALLSFIPIAGAAVVLTVRILLIAGLTVTGGQPAPAAAPQSMAARQPGQPLRQGGPLQLRPLEPGESQRPGRQPSPRRDFVINNGQG